MQMGMVLACTRGRPRLRGAGQHGNDVDVGGIKTRAGNKLDGCARAVQTAAGNDRLTCAVRSGRAFAMPLASVYEPITAGASE